MFLAAMGAALSKYFINKAHTFFCISGELKKYEGSVDELCTSKKTYESIELRNSRKSTGLT